MGAAGPFLSQPWLPPGTPGLVVRPLLCSGQAPEPYWAAQHDTRPPSSGVQRSLRPGCCSHGPSCQPSSLHSWTRAPSLPTGHPGHSSSSTLLLCAPRPPVTPSSEITLEAGFPHGWHGPEPRDINCNTFRAGSRVRGGIWGTDG